MTNAGKSTKSISAGTGGSGYQYQYQPGAENPAEHYSSMDRWIGESARDEPWSPVHPRGYPYSPASKGGHGKKGKGGTDADKSKSKSKPPLLSVAELQLRLRANRISRITQVVVIDPGSMGTPSLHQPIISSSRARSYSPPSCLRSLGPVIALLGGPSRPVFCTIASLSADLVAATYRAWSRPRDQY
ncbi:hypothetical protein B0T26DRAFT_745784 [Lasiosphaeria miniovina]|uniref:Uncharacterized protein n=1 Tax=Lasiosphaeria miniovina TaxID=1954250 RepID=A0AA40BGG7_9PEZI|nr:uncharacterized protein B0T26DRAFT_745784 [Lasiosphaeria miniovina]KAK0733781.1 hypothetical protein B0T26DRAFT_745784 [Lasiosphaeria miniovina]